MFPGLAQAMDIAEKFIIRKTPTFISFTKRNTHPVWDKHYLWIKECCINIETLEGFDSVEILEIYQQFVSHIEENGGEQDPHVGARICNLLMALVI